MVVATMNSRDLKHAVATMNSRDLKHGCGYNEQQRLKTCCGYNEQQRVTTWLFVLHVSWMRNATATRKVHLLHRYA